MKKLYCRHCKEAWEEDECATFWDSPDGGPPYQQYLACPICGASETPEFGDADICDICGEAVPDTTYIGDLEVCDCCRKVLTGIVLKTIEQIQTELDTDEEKATELLEYYYA